MNSMETAPKDGTRILLLHAPQYFNGYGRPWKQVGTKWEECVWDSSSWSNGSWMPWSGSEKIMSSTGLHPLGWLSVPETE